MLNNTKNVFLLLLAVLLIGGFLVNGYYNFHTIATDSGFDVGRGSSYEHDYHLSSSSSGMVSTICEYCHSNIQVVTKTMKLAKKEVLSQKQK